MKTKQNSFPYVVSCFFRTYLPGECGFSVNTIASYRDAFKQLLFYCDKKLLISPDKLSMTDITRECIIGFLASLETDGKSISTRNQRLAAIKAFFDYVKYVYPEYLGEASDILAIRFKKQPVPTVNYLTPDGIGVLLRQPNSRTKSGYRDMLMLTLMYDSGARVSEIAQICVGDIRTQNPATIILHGKGSKDRIVPLSEKTNALIQKYLEKERLSGAQNRDTLLFVNHSGEKLTRAGVAFILQKYIALAKVDSPDLIPQKFSPHCMRHSKAMHLLQAGVALIYIRDFLGHKSITTTEIYAKADSKSKRAALEMAYSDIDHFGQSTEPLWNENISLMKFLEELCHK